MANEEQNQATPPATENAEQLAPEIPKNFEFSPSDDKKTNDVNDVHDSIIQSQFVGDSNQIGAKGEECVDIVTEYYWIQNKPNMTGIKDLLAPVPFCYAIEYKQKHGVTATNITNNIIAIGNVGKNIIENAIGEGNYDKLSDGLSTAFDKVKTTISKALSSMGEENKTVQDFANGVSGFVGKLKGISGNKDAHAWNGNGHLNTELLSPYFYLYSLEATGKKFCFPFLTDGAASWTVANSFSADGSTSILTKALTETMDKLLNEGLIKFAADAQDLSNLLSTDSTTQSGFTMYNIEKAKAFAFPSGGKTVRVRFPLFNTIKVDAWKDNYKFIMLFGLRNMLFRKNNVQYYPPLFYDVSIPGFGRMPLSYVKSFTVKPVGMTRMKNIKLSVLGLNLKYGNFHDDLDTSVIVPEAWVIDIEFESLIADSANQMLSSMFDLPVSVNIKSSEELTTVNLHNNAQLERMSNIA